MNKVKLYQDKITIAGQAFLLERVKNLDDLVDEISDELFNEDERLPYWAELWPSAFALTEFILQNREIFKNKNILELGCGMGLTSMALSLTNPGQFTTTDYEQAALEATTKNYHINKIESVPELKLLDWRKPNLKKKFELIVASDVAYEERFFQPLTDLFKNHLSEDGEIILAEPNRTIARTFFGKLAMAGFQFNTIDKFVEQEGKNIKVTIYRIVHKK
ncbi:MAG: methyltransferase domain-containing protein [Calditrichaeota bacterium]|nr:MAG: methyltransferase domain-containing protein [Calditrichota bacterium]MBL1205883.1 methyltransferase domain-containing protein [Calditrichota bacterium]NOG45711.1 methyltransferase domain-containing protein [Calditrichota bacterium]